MSLVETGFPEGKHGRTCEMTMRFGGVLAAVVLLVTTGTAQAHYPICDCKMVDAKTVRCVGGFSDGSKAPGVTLDVISYDEQILVKGKLDADSSFSFPRPEQDFYVLFDAGPGHTVEVENSNIK